MAVFVIVTPGFPANEEDTTCLPAFQQFALSLKKKYPLIQIIVLTFQYPFEEKEYKWNGIKVIALGGKNRGNFRKLLLWVKATFILKSIARENKIVGLISLWLGDCAFVANRFSKKRKLKHLIWIIGQDAKKGNKYVKWILPKSEELIAMSDFLKDQFYKNYAINPAFVVENGINEFGFPQLNRGMRNIDVLGVGSLTPLKNYGAFIEIIYELKKTIPEIKSVIVGSGEQMDELKKKVAALGLVNNITFAGLLAHTEVFEMMNNSKIFLHTSTYEGNSTVLMEALYSGCYTLSTQPLSLIETKNLRVCHEKSEFIRLSAERLSNNLVKTERITFNTMDNSVLRIMNLFLE